MDAWFFAVLYSSLRWEAPGAVFSDSFFFLCISVGLIFDVDVWIQKADLVNQSLVYLGWLCGFFAIWERCWDLIFGVVWVPRAKSQGFLELVSRTLFLPTFESKSGRLGISKRGFRKECMAKTKCSQKLFFHDSWVVF